jgi:hypothetical protein
VKVTKAQLKQIIKEEMSLIHEVDYDDPEYGADAEMRHQADQGATEFIEKYPKLSWASGIVKVLYRMGFSIVAPHPAALHSAAAERRAADRAGDALQEGMENLTPENIQMVLQALGKLALLTVPVAAASVALTNAVHGKPDAEQEKADLYAAAKQAGSQRTYGEY